MADPALRVRPRQRRERRAARPDEGDLDAAPLSAVSPDVVPPDATPLHAVSPDVVPPDALPENGRPWDAPRITPPPPDPSADPVTGPRAGAPHTIAPPPGRLAPSGAPVQTTRYVARPAPPASMFPPLPAGAAALRGEATEMPSVARASGHVARVGVGLWIAITAGCAVGAVLLVLTLRGRLTLLGH